MKRYKNFQVGLYHLAMDQSSLDKLAPGNVDLPEACLYNDVLISETFDNCTPESKSDFVAEHFTA